jgi:fanconi-associated nuclease 1
MQTGLQINGRSYVRLFLRKTSAWHRISGLGYHSDVSDMQSALDELQEERKLPPSTPTVGLDDQLESLDECFSFAQGSELITTLEEASTLLKLDELKLLAKDAKIGGKNKKELVQNLRRSSREQVSLQSLLRRTDTASTSEADDDCASNADAVSIPDTNRDAYFMERIMNETGPLIRLSLTPLRVFERVHLVFYRSTEWTEKSLTTIILARMSKRNFPEYIVSRSASVFGTRELLLEFEASLRMQFRIDNILEFNGKPTDDGYQQILDTLDQVFPRWRALLKSEREKENSLYHSGEGAYLRRLSPAWVYTRIIHKATYVLGRQKQHEREHDILTELLEQRLFHHARRGAWYQRKALIEEHYMYAILPSDGRNTERQKRFCKRVALQTCETGLQDPLVHLIYHYDLQKRISKLERACNIPKREQHDFSHARLVAPVQVYFEGVRIHQDDGDDTNPWSRGTKSVWLDPLEDNGECSVEAMCLSHYRSLGWKGYHSEGGLMRTFFGYLFYDILFLYIPNVFQTPFQTCPLDLHTDAFYPSRLSEINQRLVQIENGMAATLIQQLWDEHSEKQTCVVGLDWAFPLEDLLEIADLFDGRALAVICRVFAQEYGTRGGGMPDLFLWNLEEKQVKFSEVKSENDRLSDTQRLWIHVLTGAGIRVELCNAVAKK